MPNIDTAYQFLVLAGNTSGTNAQIQVIGSNTQLIIGSSNTTNSLAGSTTLTNGLTLNYGTANANSTGTAVTLSYPYTSNLYIFGATSNNITSAVAVTTANTTKITLTANTTTNASVSWFTLGI